MFLTTCTGVLRKGFKMIRFVIALVVGLFASSVLADEPNDQLIAALIQHESRGDDRAVGDKNFRHKAYGCLQIRQPAVDDYNHRHGTSYKAEACLGNRALSIAICRWYIGNYATESRLGRKPTDQDKARIWNGGPNGWKTSSTLAYWEKVRKVLR